MHGTKSWTKVALEMGNRSDVQCRYHYRQLTQHSTSPELKNDVDMSKPAHITSHGSMPTNLLLTLPPLAPNLRQSKEGEVPKVVLPPINTFIDPEPNHPTFRSSSSLGSYLLLDPAYKLSSPTSDELESSLSQMKLLSSPNNRIPLPSCTPDSIQSEK